MSNLTLTDMAMPKHLGLFRELFREVFGREAWAEEFPALLTVGHLDGEEGPVGFMSGSPKDLQAFYMQRIGVVPRHRNERLYLKFSGLVEQHIRNHGFRYVTGTIRVDNPQPIIVAVKTGWRIHGFKVSTSGVQYLQVIKDLEE